MLNVHSLFEDKPSSSMSLCSVHNAHRLWNVFVTSREHEQRAQVTLCPFERNMTFEFFPYTTLWAPLLQWWYMVCVCERVTLHCTPAKFFGFLFSSLRFFFLLLSATFVECRHRPNMPNISPVYRCSSSIHWKSHHKNPLTMRVCNLGLNIPHITKQLIFQRREISIFEREISF